MWWLNPIHKESTAAADIFTLETSQSNKWEKKETIDPSSSLLRMKTFETSLTEGPAAKAIQQFWLLLLSFHSSGSTLFFHLQQIYGTVLEFFLFKRSSEPFLVLKGSNLNSRILLLDFSLMEKKPQMVLFKKYKVNLLLRRRYHGMES